jgi:hypothetical protein
MWVFRTFDQRKKMKREALFTRNVKKLFLEQTTKLKETEHVSGGDESIFNTCIYTLLLDACQNLTTRGSCFVEDLVPMGRGEKFPHADVMHAIVKVPELYRLTARSVTLMLISGGRR